MIAVSSAKTLPGTCRIDAERPRSVEMKRLTSCTAIATRSGFDGSTATLVSCAAKLMPVKPWLESRKLAPPSSERNSRPTALTMQTPARPGWAISPS